MLGEQNRDVIVESLHDLVVLDDAELSAALDAYRATVLLRTEEQIEILGARLAALEADLAKMRDAPTTGENQPPTNPVDPLTEPTERAILTRDPEI
jgi:predicted trehalose synthase